MGNFSRDRLPEMVLREIYRFMLDAGLRIRMEAALAVGAQQGGNTTYTLTRRKPRPGQWAGRRERDYFHPRSDGHHGGGRHGRGLRRRSSTGAVGADTGIDGCPWRVRFSNSRAAEAGSDGRCCRLASPAYHSSREADLYADSVRRGPHGRSAPGICRIDRALGEAGCAYELAQTRAARSAAPRQGRPRRGVAAAAAAGVEADLSASATVGSLRDPTSQCWLVGPPSADSNGRTRRSAPRETGRLALKHEYMRPARRPGAA